jgi:hypothetical protein
MHKIKIEVLLPMQELQMLVAVAEVEEALTKTK